MNINSKYSQAYFDRRRVEGKVAAETIVPIIVEQLSPKSVVDVGCGSGAWLEAFQKLGVEDLYGLDGPWVEVDKLPIAREKFQEVDLSKPFEIKRDFDLAICLEVGEHLPPGRAASFVADLSLLAPVIVFSAAIPHQGGTGHVNEQWPEYWASQFAKEGYAAYDFLRPCVWQASIPFWYSQNIIIYVRRSMQELQKRLSPYYTKTPLSLVHPDLYHRYVCRRKVGVFEHIRGKVKRLLRRMVLRRNSNN